MKGANRGRGLLEGEGGCWRVGGGRGKYTGWGAWRGSTSPIAQGGLVVAAAALFRGEGRGGACRLGRLKHQSVCLTDRSQVLLRQPRHLMARGGGGGTHLMFALVT